MMGVLGWLVAAALGSSVQGESVPFGDTHGWELGLASPHCWGGRKGFPACIVGFPKFEALNGEELQGGEVLW